MPKPKQVATTRKIKDTDPECPTNIVGQPVDQAYLVFWESQKIGRVWQDGESWSWSLHEISKDRTMGLAVFGGGAESKTGAIGHLLDAEKRRREGKLVGMRPPQPVTVEIKADG
jgi:hypothetical protein